MKITQKELNKNYDLSTLNQIIKKTFFNKIDKQNFYNKFYNNKKSKTFEKSEILLNHLSDYKKTNKDYNLFLKFYLYQITKEISNFLKNSKNNITEILNLKFNLENIYQIKNKKEINFNFHIKENNI